MDFHQMCRWLRGQSFPTTVSQLRQDVLLFAPEPPEGVLVTAFAQALFATLDQVLDTLSFTGEFRRSGDLTVPALTKVERL